MAHKLSSNLRSAVNDPCGKPNSVKRPICVGANIEQRPWKPTVRKGNLNNEFVPGKPSYRMLPPYLGPNVVDSKKKSAPAYSLVGQLTQKRNYAEVDSECLNIRGLCNKGRQTAPAFSLKWREEGVKRSQTPSASKYSIEGSYKATTKTIPKFSFGKKPAIIKTLTIPAANVYNLPPVFGTAKEGRIKSAPAFSMLGRAKPRKIPALLFPGPGDYETNYRYLQKLPPRYTLHSKHKVITDEHIKPGPAAWSWLPRKSYTSKVCTGSFIWHKTYTVWDNKSHIYYRDPSICRRHFVAAKQLISTLEKSKKNV